MKEMIDANLGFKRLFFFWSGIIATVAYRAIVVLNDFWTKFAWYIGTLGFILYFGHRAQVEKKKAEIVVENNLVNYVNDLKKIKKEQKDALIYLVKTSVTSKSKWNSLFIFWLSIIALIIGIIFDFLIPIL